MPGISTWDHAKILENSYRSDRKESISFRDKEIPKLTCSGLSGLNRGCSCRDFAILESSCLAKQASSRCFYLVDASSL